MKLSSSDSVPPSSLSREDAALNVKTAAPDDSKSGDISHCHRPHILTTSRFPVASCKESILELVRSNIVTIVVGETGSGKSTQLPQYVLDDAVLHDVLLPGSSAERGVTQRKDDENQGSSLFRVCVTQPRRVAATAMARRVAEERGCVVGEEVGYAIRFDDCSSKQKTQIKYVTDGVALREILETGGFERYQVFIVDEAHERSLNTDILFSLIKQLISKASTDFLPKIRFLVTSATLDTAKFSKFFNDAPVVRIPERCYSVDVVYSPMAPAAGEQENLGRDCIPSPSMIVNAAVNAALRLHLLDADQGGGEGHILVFLTGRAECDAACEATLQRLNIMLKQTALQPEEKRAEVGDAVVIPLYGALNSEDQAVVFKPTPPGCRKIIFTTNVAETSVTVEDVEFVVDLGLVKQKTCHPKTGAETLSVVWISKSQAEQRAGRAGRSRHGKCFRVYSEEQYQEFLDTPMLEIHRANLSSVVLQLKSLGFDDVLNVPFMDSPSKEAVLLSIKQLFLIGALSPDGTLTGLGRRIVSLPLDPAHARCIIAAAEYGVLTQVIRIIAMLSVDHIWVRPPPVKLLTTEDTSGLKSSSSSPQRSSSSLHYDHKKAADVFERFADASGDHVTLLNVFDAFSCVPKNHRAKWCRNHFLFLRPLLQAEDIARQLLSLTAPSFADDSDRSTAFTSRKKHRAESNALEPRLSKQHHPARTERILKALCEGFFVNLAKLSSTAFVGSGGSLLEAAESMKYNQQLLWVTLRDGQLVRYDPMMGYRSLKKQHFEYSPKAELVIFNEIAQWGPSPRHRNKNSGGFTIGAIRIVSGVEKQWVEPLLQRFTQLDLRRVALRSHSTAPASSKPDPPIAPADLPSQTSTATLFKVQVVQHPVPLLSDTKNPNTTCVVDSKLNEARERYLARRHQKKT